MSVKPKKNEIRKAVDKIPGLIFEQVEFTQTKKEDPPITQKNNIPKNKNKKRLVWFGVIIITLIIIMMWSWNTFVNFDTILKKEKSSLIDQAKESFNKAQQETASLQTKGKSASTTEEKLSDEEIKAKIKNSLNILIDELNTISTSTEATTNTAPSLPLSKTVTNTEENIIHPEL